MDRHIDFITLFQLNFDIKFNLSFGPHRVIHINQDYHDGLSQIKHEGLEEGRNREELQEYKEQFGLGFNISLLSLK